MFGLSCNERTHSSVGLPRGPRALGGLAVGGDVDAEATRVSGSVGGSIHDAQRSVAGNGGGGGKDGLSIELDLRLVTGRVEDLVADAEHPGASAAAARLVAQVDPSAGVGENGHGDRRAHEKDPPPYRHEGQDTRMPWEAV